MAISDTYRNQLAQLEGKRAQLLKEQERYDRDALKAEIEASQKREQATRTSSAISAKSYTSAAQRAAKKAVDARKQSADRAKKLADNSRAVASKQAQLTSAEKTEARQADQARRRERQTELSHARSVARASDSTVHHIHALHPPKPEPLRVLYLTANSGRDLSTEQEVRQVQRALRGAKFRDLVEVSARPAATLEDLMDGLNDVRPHIVHFSGHGGRNTLGFESEWAADQDSSEAHVDYSLLLKALNATDSSPTLLVLNACSTLADADMFLPVTPVVIAMSEDVLDTAAIIFASQFYAAIASAQSIGSALSQAKVMIEAALPGEDASDLPQARHRADVDLSSIILVEPA